MVRTGRSTRLATIQPSTTDAFAIMAAASVVLWFLTPYSGPVVALAGVAGAGLSFTAALVLMRRAREYAESGAVHHPEVTDRGSASGPASFLRQSAAVRAATM